MKLVRKLREKRGSITLMGLGMLPVFIFIAGLIILIMFFWISYARLITAAEAGALTATKVLEDGTAPMLGHSSLMIEEVSIYSNDVADDSLAEQVQKAVMKNGGGPHGEIICINDEIQVVASTKVLGRWVIHARGRGPQRDGLSTKCNWRKISY